MTDLISIYIVAVMFYLIDSIRRTGTQAWVFRPPWKGSAYHVHQPLVYPSNGDWGWVILNIIRPGSPVLMVDPPEIRIAEPGVALGRTDDARKLQAVAWQAIHQITVDDNQLMVNQYGVACADPQLWRDRLDKLRRHPEAVTRTLEESFQTKDFKERLSAFHKASGRLPLLVSAELLTIVLLLPLLGALLGPGPGIIATAVLLYAQSATIAVLFASAYRELYGNTARPTAWKMGLYPIAAVRAVDELARPLLAPFHPIAIASVLADPSGQTRIGREALRDALFPLNAAADSHQITEILQWHAAAMERLLPPKPRSAIAVPEQSGDAQAYCPRCQAQYRKSDGDCGDCPGVALQSFAEPRSKKR